MVSFAQKVKKQIIESGSHGERCIAAETYGLLLFSRLLCLEKSVYRTQHQCVALRIAEMTAAVAGVYVKVTEPKRENGQRPVYLVEIPYIEQRRIVVARFSGDAESIINGEMLHGDDCLDSFLKGAFLASGTLSDPGKAYHLEIAAHSPGLCSELCALLREKDVKCSTLMRKSGCSAYIKGSSDIENLLALLGAGNAYMEFIDLKITREINNIANRCANCDSANIQKTVVAAGEQVAAIKIIDKRKGIDSLPEELRALARMRLENPEMTLRELAESLDPPLTRSGVNHRLQRIIDISRELKSEITIRQKQPEDKV